MKLVLTIILGFLINSYSTFGQELRLSIPDATVNFYFHGDKVNGSVAGLDGKIKINLGNLNNSSVSGSVAVSTIQTGIKMRDKHLKSSDYFDADKHPKMTFTSSGITEKDNVLTIKGKLTIKTTTREEVFVATIEKDKIIFKSTINTADYDVMKKKKREDTQVDITIIIPLI